MTYENYVLAYKTMIGIFNIGFPDATNDKAIIHKMVKASDLLANFTTTYPEHSAKYEKEIGGEEFING